MQDIAVGILEPDGLEAIGAVDAVLIIHAHIRVMLESYPLARKIGDNGLDPVTHTPGDGVGLVGAGEVGDVDNQRGLAGLEGKDVVVALAQFEPELVLVEVPGARNILDRHDGGGVDVLEHGRILAVCIGFRTQSPASWFNDVRPAPLQTGYQAVLTLTPSASADESSGPEPREHQG